MRRLLPGFSTRRCSGRRRRWPAVCLPVLLACGTESPVLPPPPDWFEEVHEAAGLDFVHVHGGSGRRYMVETMGAGGGLLDYDNDGLLDVYLVQSGPLPGFADPAPLPNRLYRNRGDGTFADVTAATGAGDPGYGMGVCSGDVDNDGFLDLYLTNFGADRLLRNDGGRRFDDVTAQAGIDNPRWGTSCAFADYDRDGCLDLYVVNYVDFDLDNHRRCGPEGLHMYCHPDVYNGVPDLLYKNRCDGTGGFEEVGARAGVRNEEPRESKGLGVLWTDYDDDGAPDLYVSNDSTRNFLYRNLGDGSFEEVGVMAGAAFNDAGLTEAGMGVDAGDVDGDGWIDLVVSNLDFETNTYYRNQGHGVFFDTTTLAGLAGPSTRMVGFGVSLSDFDNDGDLDLFVANGHILDNVAEDNPTLSYAQRDQLFENLGGRFELVGRRGGGYFDQAWVGRAAAAGDLDNDGDVDLLITNCDQPPMLLRNRIGERRSWLGLELRSRYGGRSAIGARVRLVTPEKVLVEEVRSGTGYLSQGDLRLHFGLGDGDRVERLEIRWPEGETEVVAGEKLRVNAWNILRQPG